MSDTKFSNLTAMAATDVDRANDQLCISDISANESKKISPEALAESLGVTGIIDTFTAALDGDSIDWSSLPSDADAFEIVVMGCVNNNGSGSSGMIMTFNTDTTDSNYHYERMGRYNNTDDNSEGATRNIGIMSANSTTTQWSRMTIYISGNNISGRWTCSEITSSYSDSSTALGRVSQTSVWKDTSTVDRIRIDDSGGNGFKAGSIAYIRKIKFT